MYSIVYAVAYRCNQSKSDKGWQRCVIVMLYTEPHHILQCHASCVSCEVWCIIDYVDTHPHHHPSSSSSSIIINHQPYPTSSNINLPKHHHWTAFVFNTTKTNRHIFGFLLTPGHPLSMRLGGTTLRRTSRCCRGGGNRDVGHGIRTSWKKSWCLATSL